MNIKFLKQKEYQDILSYLAVFLIILSSLIYFRGVNFDFTRPEIVLEEREDFLEIKKTLDIIEDRHLELDRFRPFNPIEPFANNLGRPNPFIIEDVRIIVEDNLPVAEDRVVVPQ